MLARISGQARLAGRLTLKATTKVWPAWVAKALGQMVAGVSSSTGFSVAGSKQVATWLNQTLK